MKKTIGDQIRSRRERIEMTRAQVAKRLGISVGYLGHLETDAPVRLSERVQQAIHRVLGLRLTAKAVTRHNDRSAKWYRDYRAKMARSKKRAAAFQATKAGVRELMLQSQRRAKINGWAA